MNCVAKIFPSNYEFQDLCSRRTIGSAKEIDGLYYLVEDPIKSIQAQVASNDVFSFSIEHQIMLWRRRLGHPSFSYLKQLSPSFFKNKIL